MKKIKITVNNTYSFEMCDDSKIISLTGYKDKCDMTINYPNNWAYTRAVQHGFSIVQSIIDGKII